MIIMEKVSISGTSLPGGGGAIKGIGETFQPNSFSGTAAYTIPVPITAGRGLAPSLSLAYNSGSGNSIFGVGWDVEIPEFTIRTEKGIPKYDGTDIFLYSGKELVPRENATRTETDQQGDIWSICIYFPRVEDDYSRIEYHKNQTTGESFWRTFATNNTVSEYGSVPEARVADPDDAARIFSWQIVSIIDPKGNKVQFRYQRENGQETGILNRGAFTRNYIDRIFYGNYYNTSKEEKFAFEVIFDYGSHELDNLTTTAADPYAEVRPWACRPDPFSSFRSGFELRTYRRCQNILLFHHFENENNGNPFLVNRLQLAYYDTTDYSKVPDQTAVISCLKKVTITGCRIQSDSSYELLAKPDLELTFSVFDVAPTATFSTLTVADNGTIPGKLDTGDFLPVDLNGAGLPGILYTRDRGSFYYNPKGSGHYSEPELVPDFAVGDSGVITDLQGNGIKDLMVSSPPGYYTNTGQGWEPFQPFEQYPSALAGTESVDLSGNGKSDFLVASDDYLTVYPGLGNFGYGEPQQVPAPEGFPLQSQNSGKTSVTFADLFGDGLQHRVAVANGTVYCWPNLGYGRFGQRIQLINAPYFETGFDASRFYFADLNGTGTMDIVYALGNTVQLFINKSGNSFSEAITITLPESFDPLDSLHFADILGTGTSCLVFSKLTDTPRHYYLNFSGVDPQDIAMVTLKPYLLTETNNNTGSRMALHYSSSVRFYLEDEQAGKPWKTRLFFPVQVIDRITQTDAVSESCYVQEFGYHDGYYDPVERSFRGFGFVESWDTQTYEVFTATVQNQEFPVNEINKELFVPPVYTKKWFNTGVFESYDALQEQYRADFFKGDANAYDFPDNVFATDIYTANGKTFREAFVALNGNRIRTEVYGLDDQPESSVPYAVEQANYAVALIQAASDEEHAIFRVDPREHIAYHYERNANDPRVEQQFTLEVDPQSGTVKRACVIYLPRRTPLTNSVSLYPEQQQLLATFTTTDVISADENEMYWMGIVGQEQAFQLSGFALETGKEYMDFDYCNHLIEEALQNIIPYGVSPGETVAALQLSWTRNYFWNETQDNFLPLLTIASRGLQAYTATAQFTQNYIDSAYKGKLTNDVVTNAGFVFDKETGYWWNNGTVQTYFKADTPELFFLPNEVINPFVAADSELSVCGKIGYDAPYNIQVVELIEYIDPDNDIKNTQLLTLDYHTCTPKQLVDINGNVSQVLYDPLGQVRVSSLFGIKNGDLEGSMLLYPYGGFPAAYQTRTTAPDGAPITIQSVLDQQDYYMQGALTYFFYDEYNWTDRKQPLAAISLSATNFIHKGAENSECRIRIEFSDGFGRIIEQKELVDPGLAYVDNKLVEVEERWNTSGRTVYNNKGLVAQQYLPFFSETSDYENQQTLIDEGNMPPPSVMHYDSLGRLIRTDDPKGFFSQITFTAWEQKTYDANDTVLDSDYYKTFMANYPANPTQEQQDEKNALDKAAKCYNTPTTEVFDNTGTQFLLQTNNLGKVTAATFDAIAIGSGSTSAEIVQALVTAGYITAEGWLTAIFTPYQLGFELQLAPKFNGIKEQITLILLQGVLTSYSETDIQSRVLIQIDPRLYYTNATTGTDYINQRNTYQMNETSALITESADAGMEFHFNNIMGLLCWSWTPRMYNQRITYDRLQRQKTLRVKRYVDGDPIVPVDQYPLVEVCTYGEEIQDAASLNLRGKLYEQKDLSGILTFNRYALTGQSISKSRRMTTVYKDAIDWNDPAKVPLDPKTLSLEQIYNAVGDLLTETTTDGTVTQRGYSKSGLLATIDLKLPDGKSKPVIQRIEYNASNQRNRIVFANNSSTVCTYEATTQRLITLKNTRLVTLGENPLLQNITYVYDPVGNITRLRDLSRDTIFYNNQKVVPLSDYTYDILYRLLAANGYQHPGILANTYQNNVVNNDFKQSKFSVAPSDYDKLENYSESYTYDNSGNLTQLKHIAKSASWTRDLPVEVDSNRLTGITYDDSGNLRQIMINKPVALDYNCCENLVRAAIITRPEEEDDADYYVYDSAEQRTRKVSERMANGGTVNMMESTVYFGNYALKQQQTVTNNTTTTTLERETLRIMDGETCLLIMHYWKLDDNKKEKQTGDRSFRWQLCTKLDSVAVEVDDQALLISYEEYFPYGGTSIIAGPNQQEVSLKNYRYSGKERDDTTGLYYYGHRYYVPWLMRWNKPDPAGGVDGLNLYAFCIGNPVSMKDADGLSASGKGGAAKKTKKKKASALSDSSGTDADDESDGGKSLKKPRLLKVSKKIRKEKSKRLKEKIASRHGGNMKLAKRVHQSNLYTGATEEIVAPNKGMSPERLLVRHLSTALLAQNEEFTEVQAAINHTEKTIYVASNKKQNELSTLLSDTLKNFTIPDKKNYSGRVARHLGKLETEINGAYQDYKLEFVKGHEEQHAETKIVEAGKQFNYIGGTRRPCLACSLFFQIHSIATTSYGQHPGAYWDSVAALLSLSPYQEHLSLTTYAGIYYKNFGVSASHVHDYDTDSE